MKKILITGEKGYLGTSFSKWILNKNSEIVIIDFLSVRDEKWKNKDFSKYDSILHLAGIAHVSRDQKLKDKYYEINRDLTISLAEKAKKENVKQFIFMSSIIVYGIESKITINSIPCPVDFYGDSKLQAEIGIKEILKDSNTKLCIIRTPMVYGENSKGNYRNLRKIAKKIKIFPEIENKRSMIYTGNLFEFILNIIERQEKGIFFPQNKEYISTSNLVKKVSLVHNNKILFTNKFNFLIRLLIYKINIFNKAFGDLYYEEKLSKVDFEYQKYSFDETIKLTEKGVKN